MSFDIIFLKIGILIDFHVYNPIKICDIVKNAPKCALFKMAHGGLIGTGRVCNLITKCSRTMFKLCKITNFRMGNSIMTLIFNFELTLTLKSKMAPGSHLGIGRFCNLKTTHSRPMFKLCKITHFCPGIH